MTKVRKGRAAAVVLTAAAGLTLLASGAAQAHVRVSAPKAVVGLPADLDFRVPSEEQVASTIRLSVTVPADITVTRHPAQAGWDAVTAKDAAGDTVVTWTAQGAGLAPAQASDFHIGVAALPDRPTLSFDAVQLYSNGDTVHWSQQQGGGTEPPYPAPTLKLAAATAGAASDRPGLTPAPPGAATTSPAAVRPSVPRVTAAPAARHGGIPGRTLGLAIGAGVAVGGAGAVALLRRRPARGRT